MNNNITVIGVGKLGLGFALLLEKNGYNILGIDINTNYVKQLNNKIIDTQEPSYTNLLSCSKNFRASTDLEEGMNFSNLIFILVQTPNGGDKNFYDHSILSNLLYKINKLKVKNKHLIIGCTVMPNYINTVGKVLIDDCVNTTLSYNPEFVAQGDIVNGFENSDMILIGTSSDFVKKILSEIYSKINKNEPIYNIISELEAEIVKISLNGYITTKLSFANMISDLCDTLGANKKKVLNAIGSDSRVGNNYFKPGYSFGGPCFPRDTKALELLVSKNNLNSNLLKATTEYNNEHIVFQANELLKENKDSYIIKNVCYKENSNINIIEESAKLKIAEILIKNKKKVIIEDDELLIVEVKKKYGNLFEYKIIN